VFYVRYHQHAAHHAHQLLSGTRTYYSQCVVSATIRTLRTKPISSRALTTTDDSQRSMSATISTHTITPI
jgi:hypothetical protein